MSGGQIQRHLPPDSQRYSETTHTAQVCFKVSPNDGCDFKLRSGNTGMCFRLRILVQICKTQAFQKLNPAQFELHDEVSDAIQVSNKKLMRLLPPLVVSEVLNYP